MATYPLFCFLAFIITKNVLALECYVTDLAALKLKGLDAEPAVENCNQHLAKITHGKLFEEDFRCVTATIEFEKGQINYQTCLLPQEICEDVQQPDLFLDMNPLKFSCHVCSLDYCNSGVDRTVVRYSSEKKAYYVVGFIVFGIFIAVAVIWATRYNRSRGHVYTSGSGRPTAERRSSVEEL